MGKWNKLRYSFTQARKNISRNGLMSLASFFTIASCLLILGLFTLLTLNVNFIADQIKDQCEIQFYVDKDSPAKRVEEIGREILAIENVKQADAFTKEDTLEYAKSEMFEGKEELAVGLDGDDNPFSDSYKITLNDLSLTADTVSRLEKIKDVDKVVNKQEVVDAVYSITNNIKKISILVMVLLLLIAIVIISNTIKITVFNRRKEINIMKYIGATDTFIRVPFIIEGILIGFIGAAVAFGLVSWGYIALYNMFENIDFEMFSLLNYPSVAMVVVVIFVFAGCFIGMIGSMISIRKYLKV